jgi:hypothetical protein
MEERPAVNVNFVTYVAFNDFATCIKARVSTLPEFFQVSAMIKSILFAVFIIEVAQIVVAGGASFRRETCLIFRMVFV